MVAVIPSTLKVKFISFVSVCIASGIKLAAVYAPIGATIGEWVGSSQGLGYLMLLANGRVKTDLMFAAMLTLGVMSVTLYALISLTLDRLIDYERPS